MKQECEKRLTKLKRAAEIQMRNVKMLARERARKLIEETLVRAKRQFRREMLNMLVEYDSMRDQVLKKDKDLVRVQALLIEQEKDITLKNTRMVASAVLDRDQQQAELEELETPLDTLLGKEQQKAGSKVELEQLSLHDRLEIDAEK